MTTIGMFALAAIIAAITNTVMLSSRLHRRLMDVPNERSLHDTPKPRIGGLGICLGMFVGFVGVFSVTGPVSESFLYVIAGALVVMVVSFIDDVADLNAAIRIVFHFAAAGVLVAGDLVVRKISVGGIIVPLSGPLAIVFSMLYVAWITNLYNFMDGMDGFAGGMTVIGFGVFSLLALQRGAVPLAAISACIAGASLGFLFYNFPPARIFMGDAGASTNGFLAAGLSIWADKENLVPLWISVLVFSPFIVDATVTLGRRAVRMERLWRAHKSHYYQKLVQLGWGHRKTVIAEYILMAACGGSALAAIGLGATGQWIVITFWAIAYTLLIISVHKMQARAG